MKSTDFIKEDIISDVQEMHQDHEVQMAREECYNAAKDAIALHKLLQQISEAQGLEGWVSSKITLANDYLRTVREYLEYELMSQQADESVMEDASAGASSAGAVAGVVQPLGGKVTTGKPKKVGNIIRRVNPTVGKGVY